MDPAQSTEADVLLLDEPTNHLDSQAVAWLVGYITKDLANSTSVAVSPERKDEVEGLATNPQLRQAPPPDNEAGHLELNSITGQTPESHSLGLTEVSSRRRQQLTEVSSATAEVVQVEEKKTSGGETAGSNRGFGTVFQTLIGSVPPEISLGGLKVLEKIYMVEGLTSVKKPVIELKNVSFRPSVDELGAAGEVDRHRLGEISLLNQFHLADYARCTPEEYIQVRYRNGKYGKQVEVRLDRQVKWEDLAEKQNTFESAAKLRQLGVERSDPVEGATPSFKSAPE
ncbi:Elongation factor 3 [Symbiodinium microadriaticum]|uniref:Elongation factor 3 n=1 Tax=Symbiodinium microadriaticum TaxID=2951 RepID=A0A1Q9D0C4_SYMMI|nr:Elongation factor 3 [Symbiodinium microadriaticum]